MKQPIKKPIIAMIALVTSGYMGNASAAMDVTSVLDYFAASPAPSASANPPVGTGSMFGMKNGATYGWTPITSFEGLKLLQVQVPSGSHGGAPNGSETKTVGEPWGFFCNTGLHGTNIAPFVSSDDGAGNVTLDMSGWIVHWNGGIIPMGSGADAVVTCASTCGDGDTYILDYTAIVPSGSFTGVSYKLHLEGGISIPPPFNNAPVAVGNTVTVDRKATGRSYTPVPIDVVQNDSDGNGAGDLDRTTVATAGLPTAMGGTASIDPVTGNISYTPADDYLGADSFTYTVFDRGGTLLPNNPLQSNSATVNITVANAVPVAVNDGASVDVNIPAVTVDIDILANDTDSDGTVDSAAPSVVIVPGKDVASGMTSIDAVTGVVTYTPDGANSLGTQQFTYAVNDDDGTTSNEATVIINVFDATIAGLPDAAFLVFNTGSATPGNTSQFTMELSPGVLTYTGITGFNHIELGTAQPANAVMPDIDEPWVFFGNQGIHQTRSPITELTDDGNATVTLDFSGWDVSWNGIPSIPLGEGQDNGIATITCQTTCAIGETFSLVYRAIVPPGDISGFGGVNYVMYLSGFVSADGAVIVGGGDTGAAYDVTLTSGLVAVDDATAATPTPVLTIGPGVIALAAGNQTGMNLSRADVGIKDPLVNDDDSASAQCLGGCVDFIATNVTSPFIDIVFKLSDPLVNGARYRKMVNGVWLDFDTSIRDLIGSADTDASGNCQGPTGAYQASLREGRQCIFLRIYDNGPNDTDPAVGTIADPSGVLVPGTSNAPEGKSDGCSISETPVALTERADWLIVAGFIALMGLVSFKRRRFNN